MNRKLLNIFNKTLLTIIIFYGIVSIVYAETVITLHLDNVQVEECNEYWFESGVKTKITNVKNDSNSCYFGIQADKIGLYPAKINFDIKTLELNYVTRIEIDIHDNCGVGCTSASLIANNEVVDESGNRMCCSDETLKLFNNQNLPISSFSVSSYEGYVKEARIFVNEVSVDETLQWHNEKSISFNDVLNGIWGIQNDIFVVGNNGAIYNYNGSVWEKMNSETSDNLYKVWGTDKNNIFTISGSGLILRYDGTKWNKMISGTDNELEDIWGASSNDVWVVGENGTILHYNGNGNTWVKVESSISEQLFGIWGTSENNIYAIGTNIIHCNGDEWRKLDYSDNRDYWGTYIWGTSDNNIYTTMINFERDDRFLQYDGTSWNEIKINMGISPTTIWGTSNNNIFVGGKNGVICHFDGNSWKHTISNTDAELKDMWGNSTNAVYAVGGKYIANEQSGVILSLSKNSNQATTISGSLITNFAGHIITVKDALISIENTNYTAITDSDGNFSIEIKNLEPQTINLKILSPNIKPLNLELSIDVGEQVNLEQIELEPNNCDCEGVYTQKQVDDMIKSILAWGDINEDGLITLSEAIHALKITSGITK